MKLPPIKDNLIQLSKTIFRTRRRAFALISGIVLATMILSGIVLYSSVLQQNAFRSIVGDTDFELKFDKTNNENFEICWSIVGKWRNHANANHVTRLDKNANQPINAPKKFKMSSFVAKHGIPFKLSDRGVWT